MPIYAAFDALAGIGTGILVLNAQHLMPHEASSFASLIDAYGNSGFINALAAIGSIAWVIAMLAAAVALTNTDRRRWATIPLTWWLIAVGMSLGMFLVAKPRVPAAMLVCPQFFGASHVSPDGSTWHALLRCCLVVDE